MLKRFIYSAALLVVLGAGAVKIVAPNLSSGLAEIPTYRKATYAIVDRFDPINSLSTADSVVSNLIYDGLFTVDETLKVVPSLVKSFSLSQDGKTYDFEIYENRFFQDGTHLTVEDVVSSLERLRAIGSPVRETFKRMTSIERKSDTVVRVVLDAPYPPFIALLAAPTAKISKSTETEGYNLGTGPFRFDGITTKDGHRVLSLARSKKQVLAQRDVRIEKMELWELSEADSIELAKGGIIHDTAIYTSKRLKTQSKKIVETVAPSAVTWLIAMNTKNSLLSEVKHRACLISSFDKASFVSKFIPDQIPAIGMLPPTLAGSGKLPSVSEPTTSECKAMLKGKSLKLEVPAELDAGLQMCEFIRDNYARLDFILTCSVVPFSELLGGIIQKTSELSLLAMTLDLPDVEYFLNTFETGSKFNLSSYSSKSIDENLRLARLEQDRIKRAAFFQKINEEVFEQSVTLNISYPYHISYRHNCIENFKIGLAGDAYINYESVRLKPLCTSRRDFQ